MRIRNPGDDPMRFQLIGAGLALLAAAGAWADEPRPISLTRPEIKQSLEEMKARQPRIPLPALTEDGKAKLGERGSGCEARLRGLSMPANARGANAGLGVGAHSAPSE